ncbi:MAG: lipopolysaccharide heptosyltransferase II [Candidatus Omnitrophica bacterium]|nr:lipopolysaccharide heptosyltransferase II [Candidatus Omnitrophota bacterium]MBI2173995.1 lipopolysaccharide heptosyltransferase II [Candidatus Omnitrophota bacterium]MBI3009989.1 lipopolysaccharide heptosyltransferase II [Candidatus Omnitrophota bacterium]
MPSVQTLIPTRLLLIRLDRLGDVVLSIPTIEMLRRYFPHVFLAIMVRPACKDVVENHPALNELLLYDKEGTDGTWLGTVRFAKKLRRFQFDMALVLHPSSRSHWIPWLARIPIRIGFNRKSPWLLTHRLPHEKQEGQKHEALYTLGTLRIFGITPIENPPPPVIILQPAAIRRVKTLLQEAGLKTQESLIAIHPSASCISKRWMPERFAQVADWLVQNDGAKVCLIAGAEDRSLADAVARLMRQPSLNLAGKLTVAELAALLTQCRLLLSNDSGPVHVAAAVGIPVVDIFGRNQQGLSPKRWGPLGKGHVVLHKEVGCITCLAHRCDIEFLCLTALTADEVYRAVKSVLKRV